MTLLTESFKNRLKQLAGILNENTKKSFDPSYKLTFADDNNLDKAKNDIIQDIMQHMKHVADYFGTDKTDELNFLITAIKNCKNADECNALLEKTSQWFYDNTDIYTDMGPSKITRDKMGIDKFGNPL